ncbi:TetR/AcrR family transcriptional regulator [Massilia sp. CMS3.1]|uniref:TetR/AcrR family transcriptional regulator n=1 Tax=Massilia sp. CMS3.1 TaxID=3373083 RepID=UPI003EE69923
MTQLRSDAALRRDQILDAADAVFSERGITAPLDLVVTRAGVGRATLYRNFPDRAALVEALFERAMAQLEAAAPGLDLFALIEQLGLNIVGAPALADYWRALEPGHPAAKAARERVARLFRAPLASSLARRRCRADLRPADLVLVCGMLGTALRGETPARRRTLVRRALALLQGGVAAS